MFRAVWFFLLVAVLVAGAVWFADRPGALSLHWLGYRIDTSVAVLLVVLAGLMIVSALTYRGWRFVRGLPEGLSEARLIGQRRRGFKALSKGMVAVAAGDVFEARRQAKDAQALLDDPPLTLLLSAQAAQLEGDETAAATFFKAMAERPDTEFLGLRGLLTQALKAGRRTEALTLVRRAYRLKPKTDWVARNLFELSVRIGHWDEAATTLARAIKDEVIDPGQGRRWQGIVLYQRSLAAERTGDDRESANLAKKALDLAPGFLPAAQQLARALIRRGKLRRAAEAVEEAWAACPRTELWALYQEAKPENADPMMRVRDAERLAGFNPSQSDSHLILAEVHLKARLWGEARRHLEAAGSNGGSPSARVCRMMAEADHAERNDAASAALWLRRAAQGEPDPAWVCENCGTPQNQWVPICPHCDRFDSLTWRAPLRAMTLSGGPGETIAALPAADSGRLEAIDAAPPSG